MLEVLSNACMLPPFPVHKFSVDDYRKLGELGFLTVADRVELLEGWIVPKMNHNPRHDLALMLLEQTLRSYLPSGYILRIQMPITTMDSEPEPDLALVRGPIRRYAEHHPQAGDIELVVEIADTSLARDRLKSRMYAIGGVREYWIVNLIERKIEVYQLVQNSDDIIQTYHDAIVCNESDSIVYSVVGMNLAKIQVSEFLP